MKGKLLIMALIAALVFGIVLACDDGDFPEEPKNDGDNKTYGWDDIAENSTKGAKSPIFGISEGGDVHGGGVHGGGGLHAIGLIVTL